MLHDGFLDEVSIAESNWNPVTDSAGALGPSVLRAKNTRDAMGRVTLYEEYSAANGTVVMYSRESVYNHKSEVTSEQLTHRQDEGVLYQTVGYSYLA